LEIKLHYICTMFINLPLFISGGEIFFIMFIVVMKEIGGVKDTVDEIKGVIKRK